MSNLSKKKTDTAFSNNFDELDAKWKKLHEKYQQIKKSSHANVWMQMAVARKIFIMMDKSKSFYDEVMDAVGNNSRSDARAEYSVMLHYCYPKYVIGEKKTKNMLKALNRYSRFQAIAKDNKWQPEELLAMCEKSGGIKGILKKFSVKPKKSAIKINKKNISFIREKGSIKFDRQQSAGLKVVVYEQESNEVEYDFISMRKGDLYERITKFYLKLKRKNIV